MKPETHRQALQRERHRAAESQGAGLVRAMTRLCLLLSAILFITGCGDSRYGHAFELDQSTFDADAMQLIRHDTGILIPAGARGLNFTYTPPIDPAYLARIEIPPESRGALEAQLAALKENRIESTGGLSTKTPWWRPTQGKVIVDKQVFDGNHGTTLHAILAIEGETLILYIDWST
jgi:hypothetical protein